MVYEKLGFVDKVTPLDARHFNHMENGIAAAAEAAMAAEGKANEAANKAAEIEGKIPEGVVKSVNGSIPDENGNVQVEIPDTGVKTVNGNEPDENGNVQVEIPAGGVQTVNGKSADESGNVTIAYDDLMGKPFFYNKTQLASAHNVQFEADTRGVKYALPIVSEWNGLRNVNVLFDSLEYNLELKAPIVSNMGSGEPSFYGNASLRKYAYEGSGYYDVISPEAWENSGEPFVIEVSYSYGEISRVTVYAPDNMENVHSIEAYIAEIQPIDEKFIPDTIARKTDIPEPFSGSWNDLEDKPFGGTQRIIVDVVNDASVYPSFSFFYSKLCKVSDLTPSPDEFKTALHNRGPGLSPISFNYQFYYGDNNTCVLFGTDNTPQAMVVYDVNVQATTATGTRTGTAPSTGVYLNEYELISTQIAWDQVETLDEKYIPDTIQRVGEAVVLTSPNGTKYNLTVSDDGTLSAVAQ